MGTIPTYITVSITWNMCSSNTNPHTIIKIYVRRWERPIFGLYLGEKKTICKEEMLDYCLDAVIALRQAFCDVRIWFFKLNYVDHFPIAFTVSSICITVRWTIALKPESKWIVLRVGLASLLRIFIGWRKLDGRITMAFVAVMWGSHLVGFTIVRNDGHCTEKNKAFEYIGCFRHRCIWSKSKKFNSRTWAPIPQRFNVKNIMTVHAPTLPWRRKRKSVSKLRSLVVSYIAALMCIAT